MTPQTNYVSDLFNSRPPGSGHLAIHISESRCNIAVCSSSSVLLLLKSYLKPDDQFAHVFIRSVFAEHQSLFAQDFDEVCVGVQTSNFTMVPNELEFDRKELMDFLSGSPTRIALEQNISSIQSNLLYSIPANLKEVLEQTFQKYSLFHCSNFGISYSEKSDYDGLFVLDDHDFDCFFSKNGQLAFANRYHWESEDDLLYYCILGLEECGVEPNDAKILLSGNILKYSPEYEKLYQYVKTVDVNAFNNHIEIRPEFEEAAHKYQYLLNLLDANY